MTSSTMAFMTIGPTVRSPASSRFNTASTITSRRWGLKKPSNLLIYYIVPQAAEKRTSQHGAVSRLSFGAAVENGYPLFGARSQSRDIWAQRMHYQDDNRPAEHRI